MYHEISRNKYILYFICNGTKSLGVEVKHIFLIIFFILSACSSYIKNGRSISSHEGTSKVTWNIITENYSTIINGLGWGDVQSLGFYKPVYIDLVNQKLQFFGAGPANHPGNGIYMHFGDFLGVEKSGWRVIHEGPNKKTHNYFRAVAVGRAYSDAGLSKEMWLASEVTHSYLGAKNIRMAVYRSEDNGFHWEYKGLLTVGGKKYSGWDGHSGLVFQPDKPDKINKKNIAENRFILIAKRDWFLVSNDGVNFEKAPISWPFPNDIPVFASMIRTPYGYHIMSGDDWVQLVGTSHVRHLFTKDFKTWTILEENTPFRPAGNYKSIQLTYEPIQKRVWAFSDCSKEVRTKCKTGKMGWIEAKDYEIDP